LPFYRPLVLKGPMGGQPRSKASSLSSAELRRLWREFTEETGAKSGSVGILAASGGEDVNGLPVLSAGPIAPTLTSKQVDEILSTFP
jgi:hypothetical protein